MYVRLAEEIGYYIQTNVNDIKNNTSLPTWMHIYAYSFKEYDMDMKGVLRECMQN